MDTRDPKFEQYWNGHKTSILMKDDEYRATGMGTRPAY